MFHFFFSSPFQIYHAFLEENRLWKSLGNSILFGIRRWVLNFFRNKALIVSQLKRFLAWFNSTTWNIISEIWCVVRTRKTGRENYLSQRSILQTLQASLLSFYEMFHGYCIILACIFHFYILFCTLYKSSSVVRNFLLLTQNIKPKENDSIVHKINILPQILISNDLLP